MRETRKGPFRVSEFPKLEIFKLSGFTAAFSKKAARMTGRKYLPWQTMCSECMFTHDYSTWTEAINNVGTDKWHSCERHEPRWVD